MFQLSGFDRRKNSLISPRVVSAPILGQGSLGALAIAPAASGFGVALRQIRGDGDGIPLPIYIHIICICICIYKVSIDHTGFM